jgi:methylaspartate ammonia-lyase
LGRSIAIHLDLAGAYSKLYDDNTGKILGAMYGLEQAAAPGPIFVQDPVISTKSTSRMEVLGQLRAYLKMRKMSLRLVAGRTIHNLDDVYRYIQEQPVHMLQLDMSRLGSIQETILASQACRKAGLGVLLAGPADISAHVALATSPEYVTPSSGQSGKTSLADLSNEMARTLAVLACRAT